MNKIILYLKSPKGKTMIIVFLALIILSFVLFYIFSVKPAQDETKMYRDNLLHQMDSVVTDNKSLRGEIADINKRVAETALNDDKKTEVVKQVDKYYYEKTIYKYDNYTIDQLQREFDVRYPANAESSVDTVSVN